MVARTKPVSLETDNKVKEERSLSAALKMFWRRICFNGEGHHVDLTTDTKLRENIATLLAGKSLKMFCPTTQDLEA